MRRSGIFLILLLASPILAAVEVPSGSSPQVVAGAKLYSAHCVTCHGVNGRDAVTFPRPIWGAGQGLTNVVPAFIGHGLGPDSCFTDAFVPALGR